MKHDYLSLATLYLGVAFLLLALTPTSPIASGIADDNCGGCPEGMVCVGNYETGFYCTCPIEEQ